MTRKPETILLSFPKRSLSLLSPDLSSITKYAKIISRYLTSQVIQLHTRVCYFLLYTRIYIIYTYTDKFFTVWHCCKRAEGQETRAQERKDMAAEEEDEDEEEKTIHSLFVAR